MVQNEYNTNACLLVSALSCVRSDLKLFDILSHLMHRRTAQFTQSNCFGGGGAREASALTPLPALDLRCPRLCSEHDKRCCPLLLHLSKWPQVRALTAFL